MLSTGSSGLYEACLGKGGDISGVVRDKFRGVQGGEGLRVKKELGREGTSGFHCFRVRWGICRHGLAAERALLGGVLAGELLVESGEGGGSDTFLAWL